MVCVQHHRCSLMEDTGVNRLLPGQIHAPSAFRRYRSSRAQSQRKYGNDSHIVCGRTAKMWPCYANTANCGCDFLRPINIQSWLSLAWSEPPRRGLQLTTSSKWRNVPFSRPIVSETVSLFSPPPRRCG